MATRARIAVFVKDEDMHKTFKANPELLHAPLCINENDGEVELHETTIECPYISIYLHWDGYIEGIGQTLQSKYDSYEKALNLMLFGSASSINDERSVVFYNAWRGEAKEKWEWNKPSQHGFLKELMESFNESDQEYLYVYAPDYEGNYRWFYTENNWSVDGMVFLDLECKLCQNIYTKPILLNEILFGKDPLYVEDVRDNVIGIQSCEDGVITEAKPVDTESGKIQVLMVGRGSSAEAIAASTDMEKLKSLLKEKVLGFLCELYDSEDELLKYPDTYEYELDEYKRAKELDAFHWTDGDDEYPTTFWIQDCDLVK